MEDPKCAHENCGKLLSEHCPVAGGDGQGEPWCFEITSPIDVCEQRFLSDPAALIAKADRDGRATSADGYVTVSTPPADDHAAELRKRDERIAKLEKQVKDLQLVVKYKSQMKAEADAECVKKDLAITVRNGTIAKMRAALEDKRVERWWATYNAALTGIVETSDSPEEAHECAAICANAAHGHLTPDEASAKETR